MQITKTEEYGVRLVMRLAAQQKQLTVGELAALEHLPEPTVAKVLLLLRRGGIVSAARGRNGGYKLAASASRISVGKVLEVLGDPLFEGRFCQGDTSVLERCCPHLDGCGLRSVWQHIEAMIMQVLWGTTLSNLLDGEASMQRHVIELWPRYQPGPSMRPRMSGAESQAPKMQLKES